MQAKIANSDDRIRWDDFLAKIPNGNFQQSFAWGKIKKLSGWEPIFLYVENKGEIRAAISILKRKIPLLGKSVFYGCRGPVLDWTDSEALETLLHYVQECANLHNSIFLRIDPEPLDEPILRTQLCNSNFLTVDHPFTSWNRSRYELRVFLQQNEDKLFGKIRRTTRQDIKKGYRNGISVRIGFEKGDEIRFYELLTQLEAKKQAISHSFEYYRTVLQEIVVDNRGTILKAIYENKIISAMLVAFIGDKCWAVYMANDYDYRKLMPNKLLMWEAIKLANKMGCKFFDMGATQGASFDHNSKLDNYKMAFKPNVVHFPEYFDLVFSQFFYKLFTISEFKIIPLIYRLKAMRPKH